MHRVVPYPRLFPVLTHNMSMSDLAQSRLSTFHSSSDSGKSTISEPVNAMDVVTPSHNIVDQKSTTLSHLQMTIMKQGQGYSLY